MTSDAASLRRYHAAVARTATFGPGDTLDPSTTNYQQRASYRLDRLRAMVAELGHPLESTPIVHIAGTSGKGSTAAAIAAILTTAGYRTGLHTSPYLQVATEKLQIDGAYIAADDFGRLVDTTLDQLLDAGFTPSYGQLWMAMALGWFDQQAVDVAVIEVGAGGRFDLTNIVHPMVSVITDIGYDHTDILGSTIEEIAWHKAGIIEPFVPVVAAISDPSALEVIERTASEAGSDLVRIPVDSGRFGATNAATARAAVDLLGFDLSGDDVDAGLASARLPGRIEIVQRDPLVILDGAHNPQKMAALVGWFRSAHPGTEPVVVAGMLDQKDAEPMLAALGGLASAMVLTEPIVDGKSPAAALRLEAAARSSGYEGPIHTEMEPLQAVEIAIELAHRIGQPVLVTGSLYLVGNVRGRWYPDDAVLLQRTPWPVVPTRP